MEKSFDGRFTLQELQDTLITEEQLGFVLLKQLKKREQPPLANLGTFEDDPGPDSPKPLILVEVADCNPATVAAAKPQDATELVCCNTVFVSGAEKKVAVFR